MVTKTFANAEELGAFLREHFEGPFFSYGLTHELTHESVIEGAAPVPALKPRFFFRGQIKAFEWLLPTLFRDFAPINKFTLNELLVLRAGDGSHKYTMPNPYFRADLAAEMHFSRMKCLEIQALLVSTFATFEKPIDVGALCQHYGLRTPLIDFTESVDVALFFATQKYPGSPDRPWIPCDEGVGVIYMLNSKDLPEGSTFYEIGIQPLPRPFAQRGSALLIEPGLDPLNWPALQAFGFNHDRRTSERIGARCEQGRKLFPADRYAALVAQKSSERHVSRVAYEAYLEGVPIDHRPVVAERVERLFATRYVVRG